jgi:hypothetical protein
MLLALCLVEDISLNAFYWSFADIHTSLLPMRIASELNVSVRLCAFNFTKAWTCHQRKLSALQIVVLILQL